ncbi:MAG: Rid family hydrolase [Prevotella sp.]|jgi:enamine deaminase RidA (YjgF/YER057c/UK114 family)
MKMNTKSTVEYSRLTKNGVYVQLSAFGTPDDRECHLLFSGMDPMLDFKEQLSRIYTIYKEVERKEQCTTCFMRVFLSDAATQACEVENLLVEDRGFPLSVIQQAPANGTKVALWVWMVSKAEIHALSSGLYEVKTPHGNQYWATEVNEDYGTSKNQTSLILQRYVMTLIGEGMTLRDNCVRTWFYVNDIDNQYAGMVEARNDLFVTQGLTSDTHYIASTGICGRTAQPHVLVTMDALAYKPIADSQIQYLYAPDYLNRTSQYGVSFERGTAVTLGDRRQVFISGTASIDNRGEIVSPGDIIGQTRRMMVNIEALLAEADCTVSDIQQALVYLRDMADYQRVEHFFSEHYPTLPHLIVHAPVCRPGWLIETECLAAKSVRRQK